MALDEVWLEDELVPAEEQKTELAKSGAAGAEVAAQDLAAATVGIVRIGKPRGLLLDKKYNCRSPRRDRDLRSCGSRSSSTSMPTSTTTGRPSPAVATAGRHEIHRQGGAA